MPERVNRMNDGITVKARVTVGRMKCASEIGAGDWQPAQGHAENHDQDETKQEIRDRLSEHGETERGAVEPRIAFTAASIPDGIAITTASTIAMKGQAER